LNETVSLGGSLILASSKKLALDILVDAPEELVDAPEALLRALVVALLVALNMLLGALVVAFLVALNMLLVALNAMLGVLSAMLGGLPSALIALLGALLVALDATLFAPPDALIPPPDALIALPDALIALPDALRAVPDGLNALLGASLLVFAEQLVASLLVPGAQFVCCNSGRIGGARGSVTSESSAAFPPPPTLSSPAADVTVAPIVDNGNVISAATIASAIIKVFFIFDSLRGLCRYFVISGRVADAWARSPPTGAIRANVVEKKARSGNMLPCTPCQLGPWANSPDSYFATKLKGIGSIRFARRFAPQGIWLEWKLR